ncbi:MAG: hypothetical protein MI723_01500, partial [Caulobacterales bacterium]|nr:hypothetical protein [Caulobacterales bacterium]
QTSIALGETRQMTLEARDSFLALLTPTRGGPLVIETSGLVSDVDTVVALRDGTGAVMAENDDREPSDYSSYLEADVQAGATYYLEVRNIGATGDFTLSVGE